MNQRTRTAEAFFFIFMTARLRLQPATNIRFRKILIKKQLRPINRRNEVGLCAAQKNHFIDLAINKTLDSGETNGHS
jgi:hypothetical protein